MLGIVTCFYNPCGYKRNLDNYFRFRAALNREIVTVELSFNGTFEIPDAIHLSGDARHLMWQKERLLNIGLRHLPDQYNNVAWIDTDLLFLNPNWVGEAEARLETQRVVQLCERIHHTDATGNIAFSKETFAKGYRERRLKTQWFHTGGAWAARREILEEAGLFDSDIIGGADAFMAFAWIGETQRALVHSKNSFNEQALQYYSEQAAVLHKQIQGQVDYVPGEAVHLWHGEVKNRLYVERREFLKKYDFDPVRDITIDSNGLWAWNSDKPGMHRDVAHYFKLRQEDGPEEPQTHSQQPTLQNTPTPATPPPQRNVTRWSVGVTTAPREKPTLERSLQSLSEAGFEQPRLFAEPGTEIPDAFRHLPVSQRETTLGAFPNWYLALTEMVMLDPTAEAYFLCQDDVLFSVGLRDHLEKTLWPAEKVGLISVYSPSHYARGESPGFIVENRGWKSWGALAYVFPNRSARQLLSDPKVINHRGFGPAEGLRNIDSVVGAWCKRAGLPYFVHSPSLAQHIGETSTLWQTSRNTGQRQASHFLERV